MRQYHKIYNPITNKWAKIDSFEGQHIIKKYAQQIAGAGTTENTPKSNKKSKITGTKNNQRLINSKIKEKNHD